VNIVYPYEGYAPVLFASVQDVATQKKYLSRMLIDTGSCFTCFPGRYAWHFGHDNSQKDVKTETLKAVGGTEKSFLHSLRIGLTDPSSFDFTGYHKVIWQSKLPATHFLETIDHGIGLIGMDTISQWSELTIAQTAKGGEIRITV
jgi:hypothetical protein